MNMESSLGIFLVMITLAIINIVQTQDQRGFISLDCGLPANELSPYTDVSTGLQFFSDATYIQSGKTGRAQANLETKFLKQLKTLRYFPEGLRNCYNLNVKMGIKHLIRARFVYGNYDGRNNSPIFDMYLGPNYWATIDLAGQGNGKVEEIIHIPTSDSLQICLVKTGMTIPIISTLEIRPMGDGIYTTESGSLKLRFRNYISKSENFIRYPDDVYDRQWNPHFLKEWIQISTASDVDNSNIFKPPKEALATAAIPSNASDPLTIEWADSDNLTARYYLYSHFAEIQELWANDTREFNSLFNELYLYYGERPRKLAVNTIYSKSPQHCQGGECSLQLIRTNNSTLPPLLNAIEVYTVIQFPQSDTNESDVNAIKNITTTYELSKINWQGDPCFPSPLRWDFLNCNYTATSTSPRITSLNLSSSGLNGTISAAFQSLTQLEKLDLSNNNLTGGVPEFLGNIESLSFINLSVNNLNGSIPQALRKKGLQLLPPKKKVLLPIIASVASVAIVIAVLVLVLTMKKQIILEGLHMTPRTSTMKESFVNKKSKRFTYSEVTQMTNNFQRVLGKGGFGMVYHGTISGSEQVAVKILSQSSIQGYKEFKTEVDLLLRVHHTNLVSLVGYCYARDHLALIYEFLPNGDLKQHLTGKEGRSIINWSIRLRIALEAALGLEYLHIGCKPPMVHRDVKTANILLDENFNAKLADFGLSRSFQHGGESEDLTVIAGTPGYLDPEYKNSGQLSEKSDVYSFGIVLLEIITNRPVISRTSKEYSHITQWVAFMLNRGDITEIMDPNLHKYYDINSAWRALELAMSCTNPSSSKRPSMSNVINELKECIVCENSGINKNQGLQPEEINVNLDTSVVPVAR